MNATTFINRTSLSEWPSQALGLMDAAVWNVMLSPMSRDWPEGAFVNTRPYLENLIERYTRPELLDNPQAFYPARPAPVVEETHLKLLPAGGAIIDLAFPSDYAPFYEEFREEYGAYTENHTVRARWFRSARPRATVIYVHGMGTGWFNLEARAFDVERWLEAGLDVLIYQLPYHALRRPVDAPMGALLFPSTHLVRTNEGIRQAVWELRSLIGWLRTRGAPSVGVYGFSFGCYLCSLLSTVEQNIDWLCLCCPPSSISRVMWRWGSDTAARKKAEESGVTEALLEEVFAIHDPLTKASLVPTDRTFFIVGRGDRVTTADQAQLLWEHHGRPRLFTFPGGHVAQLGREKAHDDLEEWLIDQGIIANNRPLSLTQRVSELPRRLMAWTH